MADAKVMGIVLAGGEGKRLALLTADRAKPAVPFGGLYRLVDFALSNLVNAGVLRIAVLTQYKSHSLDRHITTTWRMSALLGNYVTPVPAQQRLGPRWYTGSADAIFQSLNLIHDERPDVVVVFGADHVYRMDPGQMWEQHLDGGAGVTVAGIPVPREDATAFGVIQTAADGRRIEAFLEKPADPPGLPDRPDETFASMGNYVFTTEALLDALHTDAAAEDSKHDMGGDIVPLLVGQGAAQVYDFQSNRVPGEDPAGERYWRDVGTIDSYFESHMDLCEVVPTFDLYNDRWPILTHVPSHPPDRQAGGTSHPRTDGVGSAALDATSPVQSSHRQRGSSRSRRRRNRVQPCRLCAETPVSLPEERVGMCGTVMATGRKLRRGCLAKTWSRTPWRPGRTARPRWLTARRRQSAARASE